MITNVCLSKTTTSPDQSITLWVEAAYPIRIQVYGFQTKPYPPQCILSPKGEENYLLERPEPFVFLLNEELFHAEGFVEFRIVDFDGDFKVRSVTVNPVKTRTQQKQHKHMI